MRNSQKQPTKFLTAMISYYIESISLALKFCVSPKEKKAIPFVCISIAFVSSGKCATKRMCELVYTCVCVCVHFDTLHFTFSAAWFGWFSAILRSVIVLTYTYERADLCTSEPRSFNPYYWKADMKKKKKHIKSSIAKLYVHTNLSRIEM